MTADEIEMLGTVIRSASNCKTACVVEKRSKWSDAVYTARIPSKDTSAVFKLVFEAFVPDVEAGADTAAKMLMFMGLEKYPMRVATFFDYISLAYEFGKKHRWP